MPSGSRWRPIQPLPAYSVVSAMPATAVGRAKGRSTSPSSKRLPGKWYRSNTHASSSPNTALTAAAPRAAPMLSR